MQRLCHAASGVCSFLGGKRVNAKKIAGGWTEKRELASRDRGGGGSMMPIGSAGCFAGERTHASLVCTMDDVGTDGVVPQHGALDRLAVLPLRK